MCQCKSEVFSKKNQKGAADAAPWGENQLVKLGDVIQQSAHTQTELVKANVEELTAVAARNDQLIDHIHILTVLEDRALVGIGSVGYDVIAQSCGRIVGQLDIVPSIRLDRILGTDNGIGAAGFTVSDLTDNLVSLGACLGSPFYLDA